jgi:hypothetical protein
MRFETASSIEVKDLDEAALAVAGGFAVAVACTVKTRRGERADRRVLLPKPTTHSVFLSTSFNADAFESFVGTGLAFGLLIYPRKAREPDRPQKKSSQSRFLPVAATAR